MMNGLMKFYNYLSFGYFKVMALVVETPKVAAIKTTLHWIVIEIIQGRKKTWNSNVSTNESQIPFLFFPGSFLLGGGGGETAALPLP